MKNKIMFSTYLFKDAALALLYCVRYLKININRRGECRLSSVYGITIVANRLICLLVIIQHQKTCKNVNMLKVSVIIGYSITILS